MRPEDTLSNEKAMVFLLFSLQFYANDTVSYLLLLN